MLPSIDKSHVRGGGGAKHSKDIAPAGGSLDSEAAAPQAADAPQAAPALPYVHASEFSDEVSSGTLPPIGGFGAASHLGGTSGVSSLKIDSKSLMVGNAKTQSQKAAMKRTQMKGVSGGPKGPATHPPKMAVGSQMQMQSRSCASCDVLDFGVGNSSSTHASQPSIEADGMGLKPIAKKSAAYQSPYSQRTHKKN